MNTEINIGDVFTRLTVIGHGTKPYYYKCKCSCPEQTIKEIRKDGLYKGAVQSCGCLYKDKNMQLAKDVLGKKFGKLTVLEYTPEVKKIRGTGEVSTVKCICDCPEENIVFVYPRDLTIGHVNSCGCLKVKYGEDHPKYKHGLTDTGLFTKWYSMKNRCYNEKFESFANWGGRGITVCEEWLNDAENFITWAIENGWKEGLTIERIDVNGNYCPENCRFATDLEQAQNRRTTHWVTIEGKEMSLADAVRQYSQVSYQTVMNRILVMKWDDHKAIFTPHIKNRRTAKKSTKHLIKEKNN